MTLETPILVISLEDSTLRRTEFSEHASAFKLNWSFFPAHRSIVSPLVYKDREALRRCGRALFSSEIGAYVSHFKCWEWLVNSQYAQAIILEDDVLVDWRAINRLSKFNLSEYNIDLIRLFATHPITSKIVMYRFLSHHYHLVRTTGWYLGMQGYILTKAGARRLTERYCRVAAPVDWILTRYWEHGLINYSLFPFPVIELHVPSTIGSRASVIVAPFLDRAIRFSRQILDRVKREYFDRLIAERWPLGPTIDVGPAFIKKATKS
jgi:glycosyl transferase, family 25